MKRIIASIFVCLIMCMVIGISGCENRFAKQEYNDVEKIVQIEDCYAKDNSLFNTIEGGFSLTVSKFDGRQTLWKKNLEESVEIKIEIDLRISNGNAKIVYIDNDNNISVLVECLQDTSYVQSTTKKVALTSGLNRLKIVGYDCKNIDLKIFFDEP